jgi:hypothetical protein
MFQPEGPMTEDMLNGIINSHAQLPETIFVRDFLPIFAGKVPLEKVKDFVQVWISISGSPTAAVDIIDRKGNTLFTVPGLFDTNFIDPSKKDGSMNFAEIVSFAKLHNAISPELEKRVFVENVQKKLDVIQKKSPSFIKNVQIWQDIFQRYGITDEKEEKTTVSNSTVKQTSNVTDDDFE